MLPFKIILLSAAKKSVKKVLVLNNSLENPTAISKQIQIPGITDSLADCSKYRQIYISLAQMKEKNGPWLSDDLKRPRIFLYVPYTAVRNNVGMPLGYSLYCIA